MKSDEQTLIPEREPTEIRKAIDADLERAAKRLAIAAEKVLSLTPDHEGEPQHAQAIADLRIAAKAIRQLQQEGG